MASIGSPQTPAPPRVEPIEDSFRRLRAAWQTATAHMSSMTAASKHPAYQAIIALGPQVVPLLLCDLRENENHWFIALQQITGANPIPASAAGNTPKMVAAWLEWGEANGHGGQAC